MKICIVSFDYWNYDRHIVSKLQEKGVEASHINIASYNYKNFGERIYNFASKTFSGRNIKHIKRQQYVFDSLQKLKHQDQILVLNPHTLDYNTLATIKKYTDKLISYLYDNLDRFPLGKKLELFDEIYSFEDKDVESYKFKKITNYNYLSEEPSPILNTTLDLFYITSYDKSRNKIIRKIVPKLSTLNLKSRIIVIGKQIWKEKLHQLIFQKKELRKVELQKSPLFIDDVLEGYAKSKVVLDLMREGQHGLSFRIFEAMAMEKKVITNNQSIKDYDFYDPQNILCLEEDLSNLDLSFFDTPYKKLSSTIYNKYTLNNWLNTIFNLESVYCL